MNSSELKSILRGQALERRQAVSPAEAVAFSRRLAEAGLSFAQNLAATAVRPLAVSAYWPIRDEAETRALVEILSENGFVTALPATVRRGEPLVFRRWQPGDPQRRGQLGVQEPLPDAAQIAPDLLFVPLSAFDRRGYRIGYGAGHYDATLAALRRQKAVIAVGIAFSVQEIAAVPAEPHDQPLDFVLTETEWINCAVSGKF